MAGKRITIKTDQLKFAETYSRGSTNVHVGLFHAEGDFGAHYVPAARGASSSLKVLINSDIPTQQVSVSALGRPLTAGDRQGR